MDDGCVSCGQMAVRIIDAEDGPESRRFPVCYSHIAPAYHCELYFAGGHVRQALLAALEQTLVAPCAQVVEKAAPLVDDLVADLRRRLPRRIENVMSSKEQGESDG